jgi:hypothetical protein
VRPLLRWTSLLACGAVLAALGAANMHQRDFVLFLATVVGLSTLAIAVFVLTADRRE